VRMGAQAQEGWAAVAQEGANAVAEEGTNAVAGECRGSPVMLFSRRFLCAMSSPASAGMMLSAAAPVRPFATGT
jgi:hypothetical protein